MTSEDLQSRLKDSLQAKTASAGSILYRLTWKERVTPSGRPICALRASAWSGKNPKVANGYAGPFTIVSIPSFDPCFAILPIGLAREISTRAETIFASDSILSGWPTPQARDHFPAHSPEYIAAKKAEGHGMANLNDVAPLSGWTTTTTRDHKDTPGMTAQRDGKDRADQLPRQAYLSGWPTPQTSDGSGGGQAKRATNPARSNDLNDFAMLAGPMRLTADGTLKTGCSAGMESGGQLRPQFSRWLMSLPPQWCECAPPTKTRSKRK